MYILPWSKYVQSCYIRLSKLTIDGETKDLKDDWSTKGLEKSTSTPNFEIFPRTEYGVENYQRLETTVFFGIQEMHEGYTDEQVMDFYEENLNELKVFCIVNGLDTKMRIPYEMKRDENGSPLDGSSHYWKVDLDLSKDFYGRDIYISPYIETDIGKIYNKDSLGIFSGGEINKRTDFVRINFKDKEPPMGSGEEIEIEKVYFMEGIPFDENKTEKINSIPEKAVNEELWVSTEAEGPQDKPYGYVNVDLEHIQRMLEEGPSSLDAPMFEQIKKLKWKQITSSVWKTFSSAALIKLGQEYEKALDDNEIEEDPADYAIEQLTDFEAAALGYFCQRVTERSGVQNDRYSSIKDVLRKYFGDGEGIDQFNSLLAIEIDKKVGIKKYSKLVNDKNEELFQESADD